MDPHPSRCTRLSLDVIFDVAEYLGPRELMILLDNEILPSFVKLRHLTVQGNDGNTILHLAAHGSKPAWFDDALASYEEESIPLNAVGEKPLHTAIKHCRADILEALYDAGADLFVSHGISEDPLTTAVRSGDEEIVRFIIRYYMDTDPPFGLQAAHSAMRCAQFYRQTGMVKVLLDNGVDPSQCDQVLKNACLDGLLDLARLLIRYGGKDLVNAYRRMSPLQIAIDWAELGHEHITIIEELLAAGASVEGAAKSTPPIHLAARGGRWLGPGLYEKTLADLQASVPVPLSNTTLELMNPLFDEILEMLIRAGANLRLVDEMGNNLFHLCVARGSTDAVQMLLDADIDEELQMENYFEITPVALAIRHGHKDIIKLMSKRVWFPTATAITDYGTLEPCDLIFQEGDRIRNIVGDVRE